MFQLRHLGARIETVPQHHLPPFDMKCYRERQYPWDGSHIPWVHIGSLSAATHIAQNEMEEYEYGMRKFFMDWVGTGASTDMERLEAYRELLKYD
jgi:hypothetical protein